MLPRPRSQTRLDFNYFIEGELELADGFLADAHGHFAAGNPGSARESLENAESALEIIERYVEGLEKPSETSSYKPLIEGCREQVRLFRQSIP